MLTLSRVVLAPTVMMIALRSSSAFARRSLATPPSASISSSRFISSTSLTSSSSSKRLASSANSLLLPQSTIAASSRWPGLSPPTYRAQTRTMASDSKIKVKNPVVELDGDEVWWPSLPFIGLSCSGLGCITRPHGFLVGRYIFALAFDAGKYEKTLTISCVNFTNLAHHKC